MQYRRMGSSGLLVSEISLGSWLTYGNGVDDGTSLRTMDRAYDLGVNFFDTANVYNHGEAEKIVGRALKNKERSTYVLSTKVYFPMSELPNHSGLSRKHVMESVNASLRRLGLDYVDILFCHRHDPNTPVEETLRAFDDLIRAGKVLYGGFSEWTAAQIEHAAREADKYLLNRFVASQPRYNIMHRVIEREVIPVSQRNGVGQVVFSPLAQGLLTGKYEKPGVVPQDSRAASEKMNVFLRNALTEDNIATSRRLGDIARSIGMPLARMALAWVLREPNVASALVGASRPSQIEENVTASGVVLDEETLERIDRAMEGEG